MSQSRTNKHKKAANAAKAMSNELKNNEFIPSNAHVWVSVAINEDGTINEITSATRLKLRSATKLVCDVFAIELRARGIQEIEVVEFRLWGSEEEESRDGDGDGEEDGWWNVRTVDMFREWVSTVNGRGEQGRVPRMRVVISNEVGISTMQVPSVGVKGKKGEKNAKVVVETTKKAEKEGAREEEEQEDEDEEDESEPDFESYYVPGSGENVSADEPAHDERHYKEDEGVGGSDDDDDE